LIQDGLKCLRQIFKRWNRNRQWNQSLEKETPMKNEKITRILRILLVAMVALAAQPLWAAFVANPSFEDNYTPDNNGQLTPDGWNISGAWGVSQTGSVFYNAGTAIADRDRFAFIWHDGVLSQDISGLTPGKQYWVQFWYEARNCCGGTMELQVSFSGAPIGAITGVQVATSAFQFVNLAFTPTNDTGTLSFTTTVTGDASAYLDAVNIVQRDAGNVVIMNPSFEASGPPTASTGNPPATDSGEIIAPALMAGWLWDTNQTGTYGISLVGGVYADNGAIPDQDLVGFIAGPGSLSQTVSGLVANTPYQLSFGYNAQSAPGVDAHLQVMAAGTVLDDENVAPVGGSNPYHQRQRHSAPGRCPPGGQGADSVPARVRANGARAGSHPDRPGPGDGAPGLPRVLRGRHQHQLAQSGRGRHRRRELRRRPDAAFCSRGHQCPNL
jgi:hypothetical protein